MGQTSEQLKNSSLNLRKASDFNDSVELERGFGDSHMVKVRDSIPIGKV